MRTIDLTPLYRSSIGFDRMANLLDAMTAEQGAGYPPYNIEKTGENDYRITLAVAGFTDADIDVETKNNELVIAGRKGGDAPEGEDNVTLLYRGIAERSFQRRFKLADHVKAVAAELENGLLHVDLVREVPEALKPRTIEIQTVTKRIAAE